MHANGPRRNGGIGFMVSEPNVRLTASIAAGINFVDQRRNPYGSDEREQLICIIHEVRAEFNIQNGVDITLSGSMPTHEGLGSGTAIRLAAIDAYLAISGISVNDDKLQQLSNRGGTSGVGIHGYFNGGLIFDIGVKAKNQQQQPSSVAQSPEVPSLLSRTEMPEWPLALIKPRWLIGQTQQQEREFFAATLPLTTEDTRHSLDVATLGIQAAVMERDYRAFCDAVKQMQQTRWKSAEWQLYPATLLDLGRLLNARGADCVALTSLGPTLAVFGTSEVLARILLEADNLDADITLSFPLNRGRIKL